MPGHFFIRQLLLTSEAPHAFRVAREPLRQCGIVTLHRVTALVRLVIDKKSHSRLLRVIR